ncbi:hypothetical protein J2X83_003313 [Brevibacillus nitrificans]|nr:hypothetical protein [Brevibacillus nitrificans]
MIGSHCVKGKKPVTPSAGVTGSLYADILSELATFLLL